MSIQIKVTEASTTNQNVPGIYLCGESDRLQFIWAYWIPILIFETTVFFLVAHKALKQWGIKILRSERHETIGAKLVAVLFYDSFIYFASVFVLFTTLTFLFRYTSYSVFNTVLGPFFALISILANHMVLNLPSMYDTTRRQEYNLSHLIPLSSIKFAGSSSRADRSVDADDTRAQPES
ncbi:hypothetical protein SISSUDRAFT_1061783 [Sistotremastrum suecicum HHB10207 ss-3]|uniref:Uncharacterized protein n=1 Tax=Sistotremastrum suecicum HHB10207 ss-3 TaxID=1314776 RepID=A0A166DKN7_9AGAM|nr:hypothetical protein SISSUDRAFT_1061783 [Sistotremastrum suecicum HHB10207 ss-3]